MRLRLTLMVWIVFLGSAIVTMAQTHAPAPGSVPELPPIGLPLPQIGLPHPPTGLPVPQSPAVKPDRRQQYPPVRGRHGAKFPTAIYFIPAYVLPPVTEAPKPEAELVGGRLRVDVEPDVVGQVYLDGYYVGSTGDLDSAMDIASGSHTIEIRADGYEPLQDDLAVMAGRSVTYRGVMRKVASTPAPPAPAAEAPLPAQKPGSTTFYVIPGCYLGNVPPQDTTLPPGCDPQRAVAITR